MNKIWNWFFPPAKVWDDKVVRTKSARWMDSRGNNVKTVGPDGGFTSLAAWEAATSHDLVRAGRGEKALLTGAVEGGVTISGATTDASHYREVSTK